MPVKNNPTAKIAILIFIVGLALRLGYVLFSPQLDVKIGDSDCYSTIARNVVEGKGYTYDGKEPDVFWAPGYTFFMGAIYKVLSIDNTAVRVVQALLSALIILFVYSICETVLNARIGVIAAIITCIYPGFIGYSGLLLPQTLAAFLITLFFAIIVRNNWNIRLDIALGAILGYSALTRAEMLLFYPAFFLLLLFRSAEKARLAKHALVILCIMCSVVSIWTIRNYRVFKKVIPVSVHLGDTFWISSWKEEWLEWKEQEPSLSIKRGKNQIDASAAYFKEGVRNIQEHPFVYTKMCFKRLFRFWATGHSNSFYSMTDSFGAYFNKRRYPILAIKAIMLVGNIFIVISGFFGIADAIRKKGAGRNVLIYILMAPVFFYAILHFFLFAAPRYSIPAMPFMIIFASYFFFERYSKTCVICNK